MDIERAIEHMRTHYPPHGASVDRILAEIDSLRVQLAEARANAVPWRDGPAKGGEMPDFWMQVAIRYDGGKTAFGRVKGLDGNLVVVTEHEYFYPVSLVEQFFYPSDLPPAEPAKEASVKP